jgi:large subunit ribosomal protein L1
MELTQALAELRKLEKRKFDQTIDLLINLKGIDMKRDNLNIVVTVPHTIREKRVCGFLTKKSTLVPTITEADFINYKDKKAMKRLVNNYDYFIAAAPLMPKVAAVFGKVLGPQGKMPSPQLGVLMQDNDANIQATLDKISKAIKVRMKEPSLKVAVAKESMSDKDIIENVQAVYAAVANALPNKKESVRSVLIKFSMSKPIRVEMK